MDDEIDLRAYAEVIWRGRYAIVAITLTAVLVAFLVSRFLLAPVYQASVLLVVEGKTALPTDASPQLPELVAASLMPLDARGYQEIVQSPAFQDLVKRRGQELFGADGPYQVTARVIPQTALVELSAEASRPDWAARLANEAASLLLQEADRLNRSRLERALTLLEGQISQARADLDQALQKLQAFTLQGPNVDERQNELNAKLSLLSDYQKRLTQLDVLLRTETTKLQELQSQLANEPALLTLKKALSPEAAALSQAIRGLGLSAGEPVMSLQDEQPNPVYVDLRSRLAAQEVTVAGLQAEREQVRAALERLSQEVQRLSSELVTLQAEQRELTWQVDTARRTYETAVTQYEAQKAVLAARFGESALTLVRDAPVPQQPARPKTFLNMAVAGFLGLMLSIFGVLVAELWRQPAPARSVESPQETVPRV